MRTVISCVLLRSEHLEPNLLKTRAMLSQGEPRDAAVNLDTYRILQLHRDPVGSSATAQTSCICLHQRPFESEKSLRISTNNLCILPETRFTDLHFCRWYVYVY